jgi:hypothetical protein
MRLSKSRALEAYRPVPGQGDRAYFCILLITVEQKGREMAKDTSLAALLDRKNKLERNGKNSEGQGVLRKINRQIRKLREQEQEYV